MKIQGKWLLFCGLLSCLIASAQDSPLSMRILTYNIQHGAGMDDVVNLDRQAAVIANATPDVVGLQEVDSCVKRSNRIHEAAYLAQKLNMYSTFGPAIPLTGGKYGVAILSSLFLTVIFPCLGKKSGPFWSVSSRSTSLPLRILLLKKKTV